jgi:hypothetical protein
MGTQRALHPAGGSAAREAACGNKPPTGARIHTEPLRRERQLYAWGQPCVQPAAPCPACSWLSFLPQSGHRAAILSAAAATKHPPALWFAGPSPGKMGALRHTPPLAHDDAMHACAKTSVMRLYPSFWIPLTALYMYPRITPWTSCMHAARPPTCGRPVHRACMQAGAATDPHTKPSKAGLSPSHQTTGRPPRPTAARQTSTHTHTQPQQGSTPSPSRQVILFPHVHACPATISSASHT